MDIVHTIYCLWVQLIQIISVYSRHQLFISEVCKNIQTDTDTSSEECVNLTVSKSMQVDDTSAYVPVYTNCYLCLVALVLGPLPFCPPDIFLLFPLSFLLASWNSFNRLFFKISVLVLRSPVFLPLHLLPLPLPLTVAPGLPLL